jgi:surfeit locus 1 family protein
VTAVAGTARVGLAIVGLLVLAVLFVSLGAWQLRRAESSRATIAQFTSGAAETALERLPTTLDADDRFRRVETRGSYVAAPQFLLDNMLHEGVAGYYVLTALRVPGSREHVLVNRGWVPAGGDRRVLPNVAVETAPRSVTGRLERLPRPGLRLGGDETDRPASGEPLAVLQYPTAEDLARELGEPVFDYQLLLDPAAPDGYVRDWRPPAVPPERHLGYAGQWLALALGAFAAAIVMAVRTVRRKP